MKSNMYGIESRDKTIHLLHISPRKNRKSILKDGLTLGNTNSGYGDSPKHKAIYLYNEGNINVMFDMIDTFEDFDIYEVEIPKSDTHNFKPDEDAVKYKGDKVKTWDDSLKYFGTVVYAANIPISNISFLINVNRRMN